MVFGFNWVDLVIIGSLLLFSFEALGRSFLSETLDLLSFVLAFFLSLRFNTEAAKIIESQFNIPHSLSLVLGFAAVWFISELIFFLLVACLPLRLSKMKLANNQFLSIIPAFLRGLVFITLILVIMGTFPIQPRIKKTVQDSKIGSYLLKNAYSLEEPIKKVFGGVSNDTLTFLTIKPKTNERVNLGFQTSEFSVDPQTEAEMIELINKERVSRGLKALTFDSKLRDVGRVHSQDMFKRGYFSHYSPEGENAADRAERLGVNYLVIGENLAYAPTLELAHRGLMNSEGHRANILSSDYEKIGVGVMDGGAYGKMFTQVFSD